MSAKIGLSLREQTNQLYVIFEKYNDALNIITTLKPTEIKEQLAKFENDNDVNNRIEALKKELMNRSEKLEISK